MSGSPALRVALVGGPMYDGLYDTLPQFERDHRVTVEVVAKLPHPELNAFVKHAFESGVQLDVISTHTKYAPSQAHWLRPLDDLIPAEIVKDLLPHPAELSRIDGALLQVPRNLDVRLLHYRRDLIETPPATWDELLHLATHLTRISLRRGPVFGFLFPGRDSGLFGMFYELLAAAGGTLFDDQLRPSFNSAQGLWAVEQIVAMHQNLRITPRELAAWHYDEISQSFRAGDAAMVTDWPGSYHLYRDPLTCAVFDRVKLALLPTGPSGHRAAYAGCHSFAITRASSEPNAAAALIAHFASLESQFGEARQGAIPCRGRALAEIRSRAAGDPVATSRWTLLAETETTMIIPPRFAAYPQCEDAIWKNVQRAMLGELSAADALTRAAADIEAVIAGRAPAHSAEQA